MPDSVAPKSEQNDSEVVYAMIRQDIIHGRLAAGSKLKIVHLCAQYEFGAAPMREALARLVGDKLVVQQSQRGFRVREMTPADVRDLGRIRSLLECEAVRESLKNRNDEWEATLVAAYHKLSLAEKRPRAEQNLVELEARNSSFHDALIAAGSSAWLLDLRAQVYAHHERYRYLSRRHSSQTRDTPSEHAAIIAAAVAGDVKKTCALIDDHISLTTKQSLKAMGES